MGLLGAFLVYICNYFLSIFHRSPMLLHSKSLLFTLFIGICFMTNLIAQETAKQGNITVTGAAEVRVPPDEVMLSLEVRKLNKDLTIAKKQNDETVAKILDLTRRFGILPQNVQTNFIAVDMQYETVSEYGRKIYDEDGFEKRVFRGYLVSKTVVVRLTEIARFEEFFSEVLKTGLSEVKNVTFETSKLRENRDKAREQAMKAAKEKATAMAAAIGQTIGKAITITEHAPSYSHPSFSAQQNVMNFSAMGSGASNFEGSETFAPGAIKVSAQVTVTFLLQ
jgi:uncharacterized protein YggE